MKRNQFLFFTVLVLAGFLLWRNLGAKISSHKESPLSSPNESTTKKIKGEISQASSAAPSSKPTTNNYSPFAEPVLFRENPHRLVVQNGRRLYESSASVSGPTSAEALRSSNLWRDQAWKIWKGVSAVAKKDALAEGSQNLGAIGNYVLVSDASILSDEHQFSSTQPLAVFNSRTNLPGLITGNFAVKLQDASDFQSFILDHDLKIIGAFPQIRVYYVMANREPVDLVLLQEYLTKDPRVENVTLEIVTQGYAKK